MIEVQWVDCHFGWQWRTALCVGGLIVVVAMLQGKANLLNFVSHQQKRCSR